MKSVIFKLFLNFTPASLTVFHEFRMNTGTPHLLLTLIFSVLIAGISGCGTAKLTNTTRTATEQLLLSDAMDRAVSQVNFSMLSGKKVYVNSKPIAKVTDSEYLLSIVRQHALASGCLLQEEEAEADVILELRAGTSGTDQNDTMLGISEMTIPGFGSYSSTTIPEVAMAKRVIQKATVKIGIFAYTRIGRRPVWQSGNLVAESKAKNRWLFGMGPYQTGDIYDTARFADTTVEIPLIDTQNTAEDKEFISVGSQAFFRQNITEEEKMAAEAAEKAAAEKKEAGKTAAADCDAAKGAAKTETAGKSDPKTEVKTDTTAKSDALPASPVAQSVPAAANSAVGTQAAISPAAPSASISSSASVPPPPPPAPGTYSALSPAPIY